MTPLAYVKLGAALAVIAALSGGALWLRGVVRERDRLKGELTEATAANQAAMDTLRTVRAQAERDGAAVTGLIKARDAATARERRTARQLADALKGDAHAQEWAAVAVPAAVARVLAEAGDPDGGGEARAAAGALGPVQPSGAAPVPDQR